MENLSVLLTTSEAANILGSSPRDVARLVKRGDLVPAVKAPGLRGAMFFEPKEVEHYQAMRELQTAGKGK